MIHGVFLAYGEATMLRNYVLWMEFIWIKQVTGIRTRQTQKDQTNRNIWNSQELHHEWKIHLSSFNTRLETFELQRKSTRTRVNSGADQVLPS